MEQSEIVEGNKLIAQFMGYEYLPSHEPLEHGKKYGWNKKGININAFTMKQGMSAEYPPLKLYLGRSHHELQFNRNWSWLMPVVKKCHIIEPPNERGWSKSDRIENCIPQNAFERNDIDEIWKSVVEFIKLYNQNRIWKHKK